MYTCGGAPFLRSVSITAAIVFGMLDPRAFRTEYGPTRSPVTSTTSVNSLASSTSTSRNRNGSSSGRCTICRTRSSCLLYSASDARPGWCDTKRSGRIGWVFRTSMAASSNCT